MRLHTRCLLRKMYDLLSSSKKTRLAPSLCISYSTKSDIHGIIMNP